MQSAFDDNFTFGGTVVQQDFLLNGTDEELEKENIENMSILG